MTPAPPWLQFLLTLTLMALVVVTCVMGTGGMR